jgi:hypothetical protein
MAGQKHDLDARPPSRHAFLIPLAWIAALLASYWLLSEWQALPALISGAWGMI